MLKWALIFAVIAVVAGMLGFGGVAAGAAGIAKFLFVLFLIAFLVVVGLIVFGVKAVSKWGRLSSRCSDARRTIETLDEAPSKHGPSTLTARRHHPRRSQTGSSPAIGPTNLSFGASS
jgi:uncharacterized membrane protein YtjA (UPF0391 family)